MIAGVAWAGLCGCSSGPVPAELAAVWITAGTDRDVEALVAASASEDARVRLEATRALGQCRDARGKDALAERLDDSEAWVRYEAAFALGQLDGRAGGDRLAEPAVASDPNLRLVAVGALGRGGSGAEVDTLAARLTDAEAGVRGAAALGLVTLCGDLLRGTPGAPDVTPTQRSRARRAVRAQLEVERSPDARWRLVYALAHLDDPDDVDLMLRFAGEPSTRMGTAAERWTRLFAIRGLASRDPADEIRSALVALTTDRDPALATAAVLALGEPPRAIGPAARPDDAPNYDAPKVATNLSARAGDLETGAGRAAACRVLGRFGRYRGVVEPALRDALENDRSAMVRAAALTGLARAFGPEVAAAVGSAAADPEWQLRAAAAHATRWLPVEGALEQLTKLSTDDDARVRTASAEALRHHADAEGAAELLGTLSGQRDLAVREGVAQAVRSFPFAAAWGIVQSTLDDSPGAEFAEARKQIVEAAADLDADSSPHVTAWLRARLDDPELVVRRAAARHLAERGETVDDARLRSAPRSGPVVGRDVPAAFLDARPRLTFRTTRGEFEVLLVPRLAPVHCWNLVALANQGEYAGRSFHRVVPNFVVQGGDARGDGYGNTAWFGGTLLDELNGMPFVAGVMGMPKTSDPDTGGDQMFITTMPAPHLDARYTAFGQVVRGLSVVERIEIGDTIQEVVIQMR